MQVGLLVASIGFWRAIGRAIPMAGTLALVAILAQMALFGSLLALSDRPLYAPHFLATAAWGLSPLEDQQLAGLIMWLPGGVVYLGAMLVLAGRAIAPDPSSGAASASSGRSASGMRMSAGAVKSASAAPRICSTSRP